MRLFTIISWIFKSLTGMRTQDTEILNLFTAYASPFFMARKLQFTRWKQVLINLNVHMRSWTSKWPRTLQFVLLPQTLSSRLMDRKQKTDKMIWWFMPKDIHIKEPPSRAAAHLCCQHQNGEQLHHRSFLLPPLAPHSSLLISTYLVDSRYYLPRTLVDIHWARVDV